MKSSMLKTKYACGGGDEFKVLLVGKRRKAEVTKFCDKGKDRRYLGDFSNL